MEERRVWIRADGNPAIGVGHQMRCLSVADAFRERGIKAVFLTADESGRLLPESRGYECVVLGTDYRKFSEEQEKVLALLESRGADRACAENRQLFLLDSYFAEPSYVSAVREKVQIVCLDDYGKEYWPADGIINYNIYGPAMPYQQLYPEAEKTGEPLLLLGSQYAPLRKEFQKYCRQAKEDVTDVLITTGGADACNAAGKLARRLAEEDAAAEVERDGGQKGRPQIRYHIISGVFHAFREQLHELARQYPQIIIHENVTEMAKLMADCDLAVSAAGSTLYELCAAAVPTAYFWFVDNQLLPAKYFAEETQMLSCGNFAEDPEGTLEKLYRAVRQLEQDLSLRKRVADSMRSVTDGNGAERIAACLEERFLKSN